jgi:tetratricopeptide (TPR) repeat protein
MFVDRFGAAPGGVNPPKTNEQSAKEFSSEADSFFARGQYADALRSLERAIALAPLEADYYWRTAMCLWTAGQFVEAGPFLQKAVELNPNFASAQSALGQWYLRQGIVDLALHASGRALELAPDNNGIIESHAWVLEAAGELDACWDLMEKLVARNYATASAACLFARMARRR